MVVFVVMHFVPGGPIERSDCGYQMAAATEGGGAAARCGMSTEIPPEALEEMKRFYGFDKPVHIRYVQWLWNVLQLDLGTSYIYQDPVWDVIKSRFPDLDFPRTDRISPELSRLRSARRVEGRQARIDV